MKLKSLFLASVILAGPLAARAAVTESEFPPKTVRQLVDIGTDGKDDPMMTAAVNYCHGFAEGAVIVETAHEAQRGGRKQLGVAAADPAQGEHDHAGDQGGGPDGEVEAHGRQRRAHGQGGDRKSGHQDCR